MKFSLHLTSPSESSLSLSLSHSLLLPLSVNSYIIRIQGSARFALQVKEGVKQEQIISRQMKIFFLYFSSYE